MGEIQDFRRHWPPRRRRRGWLSRPGRILVLPVVALVGLAVYFSGSLGLKFPFIAPAKFAPSMFTSDRDCSDFASRWQAQLFYWQAGFGDPHRLDEDGDGFVCEFKPMFSFR